MIQIPKISSALQEKHSGESIAIVAGKIVSYAKNSHEAEIKALAQGYKRDDIMTTFIMGTKNYAL